MFTITIHPTDGLIHAACRQYTARPALVRSHTALPLSPSLLYAYEHRLHTHDGRGGRTRANMAVTAVRSPAGCVSVAHGACRSVTDRADIQAAEGRARAAAGHAGSPWERCVTTVRACTAQTVAEISQEGGSVTHSAHSGELVSGLTLTRSYGCMGRRIHKVCMYIYTDVDVCIYT